MWNLNYCNRKCNEYERYRDHIQHLERLTKIKCSLDQKQPKKPYFLFNKKNKITSEERKYFLI
jgi:hypothetical protein